MPPTRRSTSASVVCPSWPACHHRRITSSLVHASNTRSAGALKVRSTRSVCPPLIGGGTNCMRAMPAQGAAGRQPRRRRAAPPPPARRSRGRGSLAGSIAVGVVIVPPLVRRALRPALGRVLPRLLAPERGDVEEGPGGAQVLGTAGVDEVGAVDLAALADEHVVAVPLVDAEVLVEVVRDRVPGDQLPPHALLETLDLALGRAGDVGERRVAGVE